MTKLMTLSGPSQAINRELSQIDLSDLSDMDAGLVFYKMIANLYPGITWGQLWEMSQNAKLSGWWTDLKNTVGDVYDGTADMLGDVFGSVGEMGGDAIRLVADEDVSATVKDIVGVASGRAPSSGGKGGSEGIMEMLKIFIAKSGEKAKSMDIHPGLLYGGIGGLALILILVMAKK